MEAVLLWVITHPLISILGMIAVPVAITSIHALRSAPTPEVEPTASELQPESEASESERITEPEPVPVVVPEPEPVAQPRVPLRERLVRTSETLVGRLGDLLRGGTVDSELLADLEELLFTADLGVRTAESLLETVRAKASGSDASAVRILLRSSLSAYSVPYRSGFRGFLDHTLSLPT